MNDRSQLATEGLPAMSPTRKVWFRAEGTTSTTSSVPQAVWIYVGVLGSLALRFCLLNYESSDYHQFLSYWYDFIVKHGRWSALKFDFSNYPPLYLYLLSLSTFLPVSKLYAIKIISLTFDYALAFFLFKLVRQRHPDGPFAATAALIVMFLPTVFLNSSLWGQCDALYASALLATLYWVIGEKPVIALVAYGIACSLKPQAIFFVPFLGGLFVRRIIPWRFLLIPPAVFTLIGVPTMLAGKPIADVLLHHVRNGNTLTMLTIGAPNWYEWLSHDYFAIFHTAGIVLTIVSTLFLILAMQLDAQTPTSKEWTLRTCLLSVFLVPYFLPGMHERYFFPADLLSIVYAFYFSRRWFVPVLVQFASFFVYVPYLFQKEPISRPVLAMVLTVAIGTVVADFARSLGMLASRGEQDRQFRM